MKAARFIDNVLKLVEESDPHPAPGEVLIKVKATAICGSDEKILEGKKKALPSTILGHETAGVVEEVGEGVGAVIPGDRVTIFPSMTCGECLYCRSGESNICVKKRTIGYAMDGGFADYLIIPKAMVAQGCVVKLPPSLSFEEGALIEPLSCGISSLKHTKVNGDSTLLIIGGGPMGQLHLLTAKALGVKKVFVSEFHPGRRECAQTLGADRVLNPQEGILDEMVMKETEGNGVAICIICVGNILALASAAKSVRKRGVLSLFASFAPPAQATIDVNRIHYSELTLTGTHSTTLSQFQETVSMVTQYGINLNKVITHRFPLERIHEAFEVYRKQEGLKVIVRPDLV